MLKRKMFFPLIAFLTGINLDAVNIQVQDEKGNINYYPESFLRKSAYFTGVLESLDQSLLEHLELPLNISTTSLNELFAQSQSNFMDVSLEKLIEYFVLANALLFEDMQQQLLHLIYDQLQQLPDYLSSVKEKKLAAKKFLSNILALPLDNFDEALARLLYADQLTIQRQFQQTVQRAVQKKYPSLASQHNGIFALLLPSKLQLKDVVITDDPENKIINIFHDGSIHKMSSNNLTILVPQSLFDYASVYLSALTDHGASAYLNPEKIILYYNTSGHSKRTILTLPPTNKLPWSHIAFSADTKKLTAVHNGQVYIIDYRDDAKQNKFFKIELPQSVFSSILLTDNDLLYRTFDGNSYLYDIQQKTVRHLPKSKLDYYILAERTPGGFKVYGYEKKSTGIVEREEIIQL